MQLPTPTPFGLASDSKKSPAKAGATSGLLEWHRLQPVLGRNEFPSYSEKELSGPSRMKIFPPVFATGGQSGRGLLFECRAHSAARPRGARNDSIARVHSWGFSICRKGVVPGIPSYGRRCSFPSARAIDD